jgi:hypothetical protein
VPSKDEIIERFKTFAVGTAGIGAWITDRTSDDVLSRLATIDGEPLTKVQLNQLLVLGQEAPVSDGFFHYYWLTSPEEHPYDAAAHTQFQPRWVTSTAITSLDHLLWGLNRLYIDALLYFGNVRTGYRKLRALNHDELKTYFRSKRFDTELIKGRGPALPLRPIAKDNRYLISEMACKSYGEDGTGDLKQALLESFAKFRASTAGPIKIRDLLTGERVPTSFAHRQIEFAFSADAVLDETVQSEAELLDRYQRVAMLFTEARSAALANTRYYLSMVSDLDVYVATSMRTRQDFRNMATICDKIFGDAQVADLNLRYFDPTMSAANGHEDKGLIECLMVKCAKVLVYCAGEKESWGKDAEAAMALSLGKPVVFLCDQAQRSRFYKEVHPLSRLIEFSTGVAVGAIVTDSTDEVTELLSRMFNNRMKYKLDQPKPGYLRLQEELTQSAVRIQTNDQLLSETFWNHYHGRHSSTS